MAKVVQLTMAVVAEAFTAALQNKNIVYTNQETLVGDLLSSLAQAYLQALNLTKVMFLLHSEVT